MDTKVGAMGGAGAKARIFVSYSRKDMAFADRLDAALRARGFEPLIDRSEIYAFEDWWKRIQALISSADTVVFILSPDAIASDVALKEVAHAVALNKRFAPIVCRRVEDGAAPEPLRRLNFVFFDDPDQFEASADRLADALQTDIAWIRQHTAYGEAARQWTAKGHPGGLLLRSPVLEEAERWIAARPPAAPEPTAETKSFVAESRRGATRRRNILTGSLAAGLLVALVLAGVAYWQRGNAVEAEKVANDQRETALTTQSSLLAVQAARSTGEHDTQTAILLSLEAFRSPGDAGPERASPEAEKTLLAALYRNPLRATLRAGASKFVSAAFINDASTLAAISADNTVSFWTLDAGARLTGQATMPFPFGPVTAIFADPARPVFAFRGSDNSYFAWNFQSGQKLAGVAGTCGDEDAQFKFDSTGKRLFVYCGGDVSIFDLDGGQAAHAAGKFDHFAMSPDGQRFAVSVDRTVTVMDGNTAAVVATWQEPEGKIGPGNFSSLAMSYDGKTVLIQNYDGIQFRDAGTGAETRPPLDTGQARTFDFAASPAANVLVAAGDDGAKVWNIDRAAPIQQLSASYYGFLPNGFLVTGKGPTITLWEYPTEGHTGTRYAVNRGDFYLTAGHDFLAATGDGTKIITLTKSGDLYVWSTDPAMMLHGISDQGERLGTPVAYSTNGGIIATTAQSGLVTVWDAATLTETGHVLPAKPPVILRASGDGRRLVLIFEDATYDILDAASLQSIKPAGLPANVYAAALSSDGESLALGYEKSVSLWRVADGSNLHNCSAADVVGDVVWTDTGTVAYAMDGGTVALLAPDTCTSTQIFSFTIAPPDKPPADADIRAKQGLILANSMNRVQVWSETESKSIFDVTRAQWPVFDISFAESTLFDIMPSGRVIVGRQPDSDLSVYDLATKDQVFTFAADSSECCMPLAMVTMPGGGRLMTLWSERGAFRLKTWQMLPTVAEASAYGKSIVPECLSPQSRHDFGLEPAPPRWCIDMNKPPYNTPQWRQWLADKDAGKPAALPTTNLSRP